MSKTLSVKGWLECSAQEIMLLKSLINKLQNSDSTPIDKSRVKKYLNGWVIDSKSKGWICYAFFGFDIDANDEDFIYWMLKLVAKEIPNLEGVFQIDDFDGDLEQKKVLISNSEVEIN